MERPQAILKITSVSLIKISGFNDEIQAMKYVKSAESNSGQNLKSTILQTQF